MEGGLQPARGFSPALRQAKRVRSVAQAAGLTKAAATSPTQTNPTISVVIYAAVYASGKPYQFQ